MWLDVEQDTRIGIISTHVGVIKNVADDIHVEATEQNKLLENIDTKMNRTTMK